jgi:hypothetical protein
MRIRTYSAAVSGIKRMRVWSQVSGCINSFSTLFTRVELRAATVYLLPSGG